MVDEKGPLVAKTYGGRKWCSERARIPSIQPKGEKVWFFGAYNPHKGEVMMRGKERCTGKSFIEFVRLISEKHHQAKRIYLILDNWRVHKSQYVEEEWAQDELLKRIQRVWLPIGAAKLNRMEDRWSDLQAEAIDNNTFNNREQILETVANYEAYWNEPRKNIMGKQ